MSLNKIFILFLFFTFFTKISMCMQNSPSAPYAKYHDPIIFYHTLQNVSPARDLSIQEINYVNNRQEHVTKKSIINFLKNYKYEVSGLKLPKIAIAGSGGGYRAMICFLGFMIAFQLTGLLDTASYMAGVSGSTWLMGPMLARNIAPSYLKPILQNNVNKDFFDISTMNLEPITLKLYQIYKNTDTLQASDLWGCMLTDRLLGDLGAFPAQNLSFANIRNNLENSIYWPFPLFTAAITPHESLIQFKQDQSEWLVAEQYEWLEVNPYATSSDFLTGKIDTQEFSSKFNTGICQKLYPELSLGTFLGTFGSPYSFSIGDILKLIAQYIQDPIFWQEINKLIEEWHLYEERILPSQINNFVYNMQAPLSQFEKLTIQDAGFDFNLPFPVLLKYYQDPNTNKFINVRDIDIIFACDASSDSADPGYKEMLYASMYMKERGLPFPDINKVEKFSNNMSVFEDKNNPEIATIIYFPNPINFATLKMDYTPEEFEKLCGTMQNLVISSAKDIAYIIYRKICKLNYKK